MKFQDSSFNGLKVTVGTKSVTHARTHARTHAPKAICPINFFKVGGIKRILCGLHIQWHFFFQIICTLTLKAIGTGGTVVLTKKNCRHHFPHYNSMGIFFGCSRAGTCNSVVQSGQKWNTSKICFSSLGDFFFISWFTDPPTQIFAF